MKDSEHRLLRRIATGFLTGPGGRMTAFALDIGDRDHPLLEPPAGRQGDPMVNASPGPRS